MGGYAPDWFYPTAGKGGITMAQDSNSNSPSLVDSKSERPRQPERTLRPVQSSNP